MKQQYTVVDTCTTACTMLNNKHKVTDSVITVSRPKSAIKYAGKTVYTLHTIYPDTEACIVEQNKHTTFKPYSDECVLLQKIEDRKHNEGNSVIQCC